MTKPSLALHACLWKALPFLFLSRFSYQSVMRCPILHGRSLSLWHLVVVVQLTRDFLSGGGAFFPYALAHAGVGGAAFQPCQPVPPPPAPAGGSASPYGRVPSVGSSSSGDGLTPEPLYMLYDDSHKRRTTLLLAAGWWWALSLSFFLLLSLPCPYHSLLSISLLCLLCCTLQSRGWSRRHTFRWHSLLLLWEL